MADKISTPITVVAAGQALTGTLMAYGGNATTNALPLGSMRLAAVWVDYTRAGGSATGRPILAVELSRDPPATAAASVGHWSRVPIADSTVGTGALETYQQSLRFNPTGAGTTSWHWPGIDVSGAHWIRVLAADVDGVAPGSVGLFLSGAV